MDFDQGKAEAFESKLLGVLNGGALTLMTSIGHRTGLFDVMRGLDPSDSETIAKEAGLEERYVREWLGAMVTGEVVEHARRLGRAVAGRERGVDQIGEGTVAVAAGRLRTQGFLHDRDYSGFLGLRQAVMLGYPCGVPPGPVFSRAGNPRNRARRRPAGNRLRE